jgi:1,4-alpha-glucan branching enzyme
VITTPATYPIIPLLLNRESIDAQITTAAQDYGDRFSKPLNGIFLSECAYDSVVDSYLKKNSIKYFFLDDNAIDTTRYDIHCSYNIENGVSFFVRDYDIASDIMEENGYLSNSLYREFYRDIGYERDIDYLRDFTQSTERIPTGIKYHRITDIKKPLDQKELYDMDVAMKQSETDALNFISKMTDKFKNSSSVPVVVSCFNMELFGHRWFEGVHFLENMIRRVRTERFPVQFITPGEYLNINQPQSTVKPFISSWSENGYFDKWLNEKNDFIYPYLYEITRRYIMTVNKFINNEISIEMDKSLKQLTREILMMQSSDWSTLINYNTHRDYAVFRFKSHYENAGRIINSLNSGKIDFDFVKKLERENPIFPFINWRVFATKSRF